MKTLLVILISVGLPLFVRAQVKHKYPRAPAAIETYRDSKGVVHTRRRVTAVPERHTVTKWHYRKGHKVVSATGMDTARAVAR